MTESPSPAAGQWFAALAELRQATTATSYATLVRQAAAQQPPIQISSQRLSDWFRGKAVPADPAVVRFLVEYLHPRAARTSNYHQRPLSWWLDLHQEAVRERQAGRDIRPRAVGPAPSPQVAGRLGRPISECDPLALEVHPAIQVPGTGPPPALLPGYALRAHDTRLREIADLVITYGPSRLVTLVGGSSTGKTRACWELVQYLDLEHPGQWRVWHPLTPSRAEAVTESLDRIRPHTVIWLNDAQLFLLTADGERVAARLRALLADRSRAPVLILATVWPEHWRSTTRRPSGPDPHAQARELLTGTEVVVPDAFNTAELDRLRNTTDPLLRQAVAHAEDGRITQYLAGVPDLLQRYQTAGPAVRALLDAAIDARRLGHPPAIPRALLAHAAAGYLDDHEWAHLADDWVEQALADVGEPSHGTPGPLTRVRPRPGHEAPAGQPCYRLADYLEQFGRGTRATTCAPGSLWEAVLSHAEPSLLPGFADAAGFRGLLHTAHRLYHAAAAAGHPTALVAAGDLLRAAGRAEEALACYQQAADSQHGAEAAATATASLLYRAGRTEESLGWYQRAAEAGNRDASTSVAHLLQTAGRLDDALAWYRREATAGDTAAVHAGSRLLQESGRVEEAVGWLEGYAADGDLVVAGWVADLLRDLARTDEAITWYRRVAAAGVSWWSWGSVIRLLRDAGRAEEAVQWLRDAAENGDRNAASHLVETLVALGRLDEALRFCAGSDAGNGGRWALAGKLRDAGRVDEAIGWYQQSAADNPETTDDTLRFIAGVLMAAGRVNDAVNWLQDRAAAWRDDGPSGRPRWVDAGVTAALRVAGEVLHRAGRFDEAIGFYQQAAEAGDVNDPFRGFTEDPGQTPALYLAVDLLEAAGRVEEAILWLQDRAAEGTRTALAQIGGLLLRAGRREEAIGWYQQSAEAGETGPGWSHPAIDLLLEAGRAEEAIAWLRTLADRGDDWAQGRAVHLLESAGRGEDAFVWIRERAEAGHEKARWRLIDMSAGRGRTDEAVTWCRRNAEDRGGDMLNCAARLLRDAGRDKEADRLSRYGWEPGGAVALPWQAEVDPSAPGPEAGRPAARNRIDLGGEEVDSGG